MKATHVYQGQKVMHHSDYKKTEYTIPGMWLRERNNLWSTKLEKNYSLLVNLQIQKMSLIFSKCNEFGKLATYVTAWHGFWNVKIG